jgi:hypothetical protein
MSATTDFILSLEDAQLAADLASYQVSNHLCQLSNLVWRAGRIEGPDLDTPLAGIDPDWIDAMRDQLQEALSSLRELEDANGCLAYEAREALACS